MGEHQPIPARGGELDRTLRALADPARRATLRRLSAGPATVTEGAAPFPISPNSVSKHIRILERARLVWRDRRGRKHVLTADPAPLDEAAARIEAQRAVRSRRPDALEAALRAEDREAPPDGRRRRDR